MKIIVTGSVLALVLVVVAAFSLAPAPEAVTAATLPPAPPLFPVCHFPGHNGDFNMAFGGQINPCVKTNADGTATSGNVMWVPLNACLAHGATCP